MLKRYPIPTQERLNSLFHYDESTGVLFWKERSLSFFKDEISQKKWNTRFAGKPAGSLSENGYLKITLDQRPYLAHRIVWKIKTGEEPDYIDHCDLDRSNNRFKNLRIVNQAQNRLNMDRNKRSISGLKNVSFRPENSINPWCVMVSRDGINHYGGSFPTKEKAFAVACVLRNKIHGEFARHGPEQP